MRVKGRSDGSVARDVGYSTLANAISLLCTGLLTLIVPKVFSGVQYGYWQLYIFYSSYVGLFHLGLQDGIYLRYGGFRYGDLDKGVMRSQVNVLLGIEAVFAAVLVSVSYFLGGDADKQTIIRCFALMMVFYLPNTQFQYILLMTRRIREYSIGIIIEKTVYLVVSSMGLWSGRFDYLTLLIVDIASKAIALAYLGYACRDIVLARSVALRTAFIEAGKNILAGAKLMSANIASMFVVGVVRIFIINRWDIVVFGNIGLLFSLANFLLIFITAIGQVFFPILRRSDPARLPAIYNSADRVLTAVLLPVLVLYQPVRAAVALWLPQFADVLTYLTFIMPMCVFESKSNLLLNTYYKTLRRETSLFVINVVMVAVSFLYSAASIYLFDSLTLALLGIAVVTGTKCLVLDLYIRRCMGLPVRSASWWIYLGSALFIAVNWVAAPAWAFCAYAGFCLAYLLLQRRKILPAFRYFQGMNHLGLEN